MLHPINKPDIPQLTKLNKIARLTIAFGLTREDNRSAQKIRSDFLQYFQGEGYPDTGDWLWGKPKAIKEPLLKLLKISIAEKKAILDTYDTDMDLEQCFQLGQFCINNIPVQLKPALLLVKDILLHFYTHILSGGVEGVYIDDRQELNRQLILRKFATAQKPLRLNVCLGCDGQPPPLTTIHHAELDHFFPKSKYQLLAIHPLNLMPLCTDCNQEFKAARDAIGDSDPSVAEVTTLEHIFHPYFRPARDAIDIEVERNVQTKQLEFKLLPKSNDAIGQARVKSLNYLLCLKARWDGELERERIQDEFERLLLHGTQDERDEQDENFTLTETWFSTQLKCTLSTLKRSIGKINASVPVYAYAKWVQSNREAYNEWFNICQNKVLI